MLRTESKLKMKGVGVWIEDRIVQLVIDAKIETERDEEENYAHTSRATLPKREINCMHWRKRDWDNTPYPKNVLL